MEIIEMFAERKQIIQDRLGLSPRNCKEDSTWINSTLIYLWRKERRNGQQRILIYRIEIQRKVSLNQKIES